MEREDDAEDRVERSIGIKTVIRHEKQRYIRTIVSITANSPCTIRFNSWALNIDSSPPTCNKSAGHVPDMKHSSNNNVRGQMLDGLLDGSQHPLVDAERTSHWSIITRNGSFRVDWGQSKVRTQVVGRCRRVAVDR